MNLYFFLCIFSYWYANITTIIIYIRSAYCGIAIAQTDELSPLCLLFQWHVH